MKHTYFVTGIGTDIGKTLVSAILTEALQADYWKPIQAGDLDNSDTHKVTRLISNTKTKFHNTAFQLNTPMSPHAAADIDGVKISTKKVKRPTTKNTLIIEGAGGLLVPISTTETVANLIKKEDKVIVVSKHYLGSINHTLLTLNWLTSKGYDVSLIFSGDANPHTENIILHKTGVSLIGRIEEEEHFDKTVIKKYADRFETVLRSL